MVVGSPYLGGCGSPYLGVCSGCGVAISRWLIWRPRNHYNCSGCGARRHISVVVGSPYSSASVIATICIYHIGKTRPIYSFVFLAIATTRR